MDSTNVNSERDNEVCAAAQIIPTQKEVEIPPKNAKTGPSIIEVARTRNWNSSKWLHNG